MCMYMYIYMAPPGVRQPLPPATTPVGVASHLPRSVKISYAILIRWPGPPIHYITGYLRAVFTYRI